MSGMPKLQQIQRLPDALAHLLRATDGRFEPLPDAEVDAIMSAVLGAMAHVRPELVDTHHLPTTGGALLVGNHGLLGVDSFALYPLVWNAVRRLPRGLGDKVLWRVPLLQRFVHNAGAVPGTRSNAVRLLREGELVLVYPGGSADSFKGPEDRYRLFWERRLGFVTVATQAQVPIIPVMAAGIDHAYRYLFHDRWVFPTLFGQGKSRYDFPISLGLGVLPLPGRFRYHVGAPIQPPPPEHADDPEAMARFHAEVWQTCQRQLDEAVAAWHASGGRWG